MMMTTKMLMMVRNSEHGAIRNELQSLDIIDIDRSLVFWPPKTPAQSHAQRDIFPSSSIFFKLKKLPPGIKKKKKKKMD